MKFLLSFFTCLLSFGYAANASYNVTISKSNAGPAGYLRVTETHSNPSGHMDNYDLDCKDPGDLKCKWRRLNPPMIGSMDDLTEQVEAQIELHNYSGSVEVEGGTLSWQGTNLNNYTFTLSGN